MESNQAGSPYTVQDPGTQWINFYNLLDLPDKADEETIRKRISTRYSEAVGNYNHRDSKKREYNQMLGQQILPQCRRILLNPALRSSYDQQNAAQLAGASDGLTLKAFLHTLSEDGIPTDAMPSSSAQAIVEQASIETPSATVIMDNATEPDPVIAGDIATAKITRANSIEEMGNMAVESTLDTDFAPPASKVLEPAITETAKLVIEDDEPAIMPIIKADKPILKPIGESTSDKKSDKVVVSKPSASVKPVPPQKPVQKAATPKATTPASPVPPRVSQAGTPHATATPSQVGNKTIIQDNVALPKDVQKAVKQAIKEKSRTEAKRPAHVSRVIVDDPSMAGVAKTSTGLFRPGERALSDTSVALLTAIVATMLSITIDIYSMPEIVGLSSMLLIALKPPRLGKLLDNKQDDSQ